MDCLAGSLGKKNRGKETGSENIHESIEEKNTLTFTYIHHIYHSSAPCRRNDVTKIDCLTSSLSQEFKNFCKKGSFVILSISDIVGSLVVFPSTCYIQWWLANGWDDSSLALLSVVFAFALAGCGPHKTFVQIETNDIRQE